MPKTKKEKEAMVEQLAKELEGHTVVLLSDFTGMTVATATEMRRQLREASVDFKVVKNTLARRAFEKVGFGALVGEMTGPNAIALSKSDPVAAAKILVEFERKGSVPKLRGGLVDASLMSAPEIRRIAALPPRDVLLAQIAAGFQAPVSGFARTLAEMLRQLVSTIDEIGKKRAASGA
jgi:large subunit ribosomal protein L10